MPDVILWALSLGLSDAGYGPEFIDTRAEVSFDVTDGGPTITGIKLITEAKVPNIDNATFQQFVERAKEECPVSKTLAGTEISLNATLK